MESKTVENIPYILTTTHLKVSHTKKKKRNNQDEDSRKHSLNINISKYHMNIIKVTKMQI